MNFYWFDSLYNYKTSVETH